MGIALAIKEKMWRHGIELGLANQFNPVPGAGRVGGKDSVVARRSGTRKPAFCRIVEATRVPDIFPRPSFLVSHF